MARPIAAMELTESDRRALEAMMRAGNTPQKMVRRARIVVSAAAGKDNTVIARELGTSRVTVGAWRQRFCEGGLASLTDAPGRGRKAWLDPAKIARIVTEVVRPPAPRTRWSCATMAKAVGVSKATVQRVWAKNDLKPHVTRTFKLSRDPQFEAKFWDVIGLYLEPPDKAIVLCCDEKSQCQALERTQPGLPLGQGYIATRTHDYYRHGTVTLFAALHYVEGKIIARTAPRHRHQEWLAFLKQIDAETPPALDLHLIVDNYGTHKHWKVRRWVAKHPRFHLHFTPTSASWMNLVERFFRDLGQDVVLPGSFASVGELVDAIMAYLAQHNLEPKRYVWRADGQQILEKIRRARQALEQARVVNKAI